MTLLLVATCMAADQDLAVVRIAELKGSAYGRHDAGQRAIQPPPTLRPLRAFAMLSAVMISPVARRLIARAITQPRSSTCETQ